jgi:hypothetical protein
VTTGDLGRPLRQAFRFEAADLAANRTGRLSPRQTALLRAGRMGMQLSLAVFVAVMLGTVGLVAFFDWRLRSPRASVGGFVAAAAVSATVMAIGYVVSRRYLSPVRARRLGVARGPVEILSEAPDDCRVRIGGTSLRLPDTAALQAFQPGTEYRVYYLGGPVAVVLSGEALSGGVVPRRPASDAEADAAERVVAGAQIAVVRRGYLIVVLLGLLALGIPLAGVLVGDLPPRLRPLAWIGLLAVALGFAWLALAWLTRGKRPPLPP